MWTLSMCWWAYSQSIQIILSPAPITHKGRGKTWHKLNADLGSDSGVKTKDFKRGVVNASCHSYFTRLLHRLSVTLYRQTCCCFVLIDSFGNGDQICLRLSGLDWMFSLSLAHTIACDFRSARSAFEEEMRNY